MAKIVTLVPLCALVTLSHSLPPGKMDEKIMKVLEELSLSLDNADDEIQPTKNKLKNEIEDSETASAHENRSIHQSIIQIDSVTGTKRKLETQGFKVEGDLALTPWQATMEEKDNLAYKSHDPIFDITSHWGKSDKGRVVVPYTLSEEIEHDEAKVKAIRASIKDFKKYSCIDWVELAKTNDPSQHFVKFINGDGCSSELGYIGKNEEADDQGYQSISIGEGCGYKYIVLHEMLHTVGFFHEQARLDRDQYIKLYLNNLKDPEDQDQFNKEASASVNNYGTPYDINSLMQYDPTAFAKPGTYTIKQRVSKGSAKVKLYEENTKGFSKTDRIQLNLMYKCTNYL